jgi:hypothetical protein
MLKMVIFDRLHFLTHDFPSKKTLGKVTRNRGVFFGAGMCAGSTKMTLNTNAPLPDFNEKLPLREIFNREVKKAVDDFPQLKGRFIFVNAVDGEANAFVDPELVNDAELNQITADMTKQARKAGSAFATKLGRFHELDVMTYTPLPFRMFTGKDQPAERELMATFDHELGHLVVPGGYYSKDPCFRETAADAFAVLRQAQRYGDADEAIKKAGWRRAFDFVMSGDAGHFTTLSIDEMKPLMDKLDVNAMTPDQTVKLAQRFALAHTPHADVTNNVAKSFQPVRETLRDTNDIKEALKVLAETSLASDTAYYTFKIGSRVLKSFLDGEVRNAKDNSVFELKGDYWDGVRQKIAERDLQMKDEGLLLGMPLKGAAPKDDTPKVIPFPVREKDPRVEKFKRGHV